jgi:hypothetical protein
VVTSRRILLFCTLLVGCHRKPAIELVIASELLVERQLPSILGANSFEETLKASSADAEAALDREAERLRDRDLWRRALGDESSSLRLDVERTRDAPTLRLIFHGDELAERRRCSAFMKRYLEERVGTNLRVVDFCRRTLLKRKWWRLW